MFRQEETEKGTRMIAPDSPRKWGGARWEGRNMRRCKLIDRDSKDGKRKKAGETEKEGKLKEK